MRNQYNRHAARPALARQEIEDLCLDGDVKRRRRLVRDEQARRARECDRDGYPLAHTPRHLVRVLSCASLGLGDANFGEQLHSARQCLLRPNPICSRNASAIWPPTVSTGLSDVIGSWKTTAISRPRSRRSASRGKRKSSRPSKRTLPLTRARRGKSCSIARESMVLPDPDSPTMPSAWLAPTERLTPETARSGPRSVANSTRGSRLKQGRGAHRATWRAAIACEASPTRLKANMVRTAAIGKERDVQSTQAREIDD